MIGAVDMLCHILLLGVFAWRNATGVLHVMYVLS